MSLNGHRGHFIDKVEAYSRAEQAGLKHGDLVLEVNGTAILHHSHDGVVDLIKSFARDSKQSRYWYSFQLRNVMPLHSFMWIIYQCYFYNSIVSKFYRIRFAVISSTLKEDTLEEEAIKEVEDELP